MSTKKTNIEKKNTIAGGKPILYLFHNFFPPAGRSCGPRESRLLEPNVWSETRDGALVRERVRSRGGSAGAQCCHPSDTAGTSQAPRAQPGSHRHWKGHPVSCCRRRFGVLAPPPAPGGCRIWSFSAPVIFS